MNAFLNTAGDMDWLFEVHCKHVQNQQRYHSAVIYGNEDCPERVELYASANPSVFDSPRIAIDNYVPCDCDGQPRHA